MGRCNDTLCVVRLTSECGSMKPYVLERHLIEDSCVGVEKCRLFFLEVTGGPQRVQHKST
eukprot:m.193297 g.193297  ORF g.193297 m.193297 type:complete len:60 (-) comp18629_c0_seq2:64-243(-)